MKNTKLIVGIAAMALSLMIPNAMAQAPTRPDPNAIHIESPFKGVVVNATATSLSVKGEVKPPPPRTNNPNGNAEKAKPEHRDVHFSIKGAKLTRDGKPCEVKDILKGDSATITFTPPKPGGTKFLATQVDLTKAGAAEEKKQ